MRSCLNGDQVTPFSVKRTDDFDVSDCTILPPGELLLLERRFSPARGLAMRIRRIPLVDIKGGAVADGRSMIEADLGYQIDNMEGIAVHNAASGETIVTLISDDNFSVIQRNLLLQFAIIGVVSRQTAAASRFFTIWRLSSSTRGASSASLALRRKASSPPR